MKNKLTIIGVILSLIIGGYAFNKINTPKEVLVREQDQKNIISKESEIDDHAGIAHTSVLAGSRVELDDQNNFKSGEVSFNFKLYGLDGHEFGENDLKVVHEKKMHFLMVRDDMTGFQHLHPNYADGKWTVKTASAEQGSYQLYIDVAPEEEKPTVLRVPVIIGGQTLTKNFPLPNEKLLAQDGIYNVTVATDGILKTKQHTKLTFSLSKDGQPVENIESYLGAYGHVVLLRHSDPDDFFHVHPLTVDKPTDSRVQFDAQFPVKGRYTLYAQFNIGGSVKTFPITIDVSEIGQDAETSHGHSQEESEKGHR